MTVQSLAELFLSQGSLQETGGNRPFWVDEAASLWLVQSGCLDVFVVPLSGNEPGSRTHLLRAGATEIVFGFDRGKAEPNIRFQAVGTGETRVYRLSRACLRDLSSDESRLDLVVSALDTWIQNVLHALCDGVLPDKCYQLDRDQILELNTGEAGQPPTGVIWVRHVSGRSALAGLTELMMEPSGEALPLTPRSWLQALEPVQLKVTDTATELRDGLLWANLSGFDAHVRNWAALRLQQAEKRDQARLAAQSQARGLATKRAAVDLAAPLTIARGKTTASLQPEDPLFAASQLVSRALGVTSLGRPVEAPGQDSRDLLHRLARSARLRVRRVILSERWWAHDNGPLLAFLQEANRPVALLPDSAKGYLLVDPTEQTRNAVTAEVSKSLNPVAYTFFRPFPERITTTWEVLRFGLRGTHSDQRMVLLLSLAGGVLGMAMPLATGLIFDSVIPSDYRPQLWFLALGLLVANFAAVLFDITRGVALLRLGAKSNVALEGAVWDRLLSLPLPFFRSYTAGDLALRANGINAIQQILSGAVITAVLGGVFSLFNFGLLFWYSGRLTLAATVLVALNIALTLAASWAGLWLQRPLYELQGRISGQVLQFITGIAKLRVAGAELQAFAVWAKAFGEQRKIDLKMGALSNGMLVFNEAYPVLTSMCLFGLVALWAEPGLTTGRFLAFNVAFMGFLHAGLSASQAIISVLQTVPIYERARPILQALPETRELKAEPGRLRGSLEFTHITFRYGAGPPVLSDLSFQIQPGEFVALVGQSGSGKSTILRLLLGFEVPESGTVRYDGLDLAGLDVTAVRRQIGVVLQNGKLMPGDLFENIVGSGLFTLDDAWEAARRAGLEEDIQAMPMGMHTVLGETAGTLSGGQRQRLMIARAIVSKPRILLLDEATSALDNRTQAIVSRSLSQLQSTRLVIAHRLSTIMHADRILVLHKGELVQSGSYSELIKKTGVFADLANRQLT